MSTQTTLTRGYTVALISSVLLSTTAVFIRYLTQTYQIEPLVLAFWRILFALLTLVLAMGLLKPALLHVPRAHLSYLSIYGLLLAVFNSLWTLSVARNGAAVATVLVYSSAAFTALLGWWLLNERLDRGKIIVIVLCLGGCVLVSGALNPSVWQTNMLGILVGVLSGLGHAVYSLLGRAASQRGLNPWTTLLYTFTFAAFFLLIINLIPGNLLPGTASQPSDLFVLGRSLVGWGILLLLAAGPTVAGFGLYNVSLSLLPASVVNLLLTTEPVFTAVLAIILLGEQLTMAQLGGSLLIMSGVLFLRITLLKNPISKLVVTVGLPIMSVIPFLL
ncbi:MAG: DMT family transporter [Chloroflexi bacterium]|nr:DMT family transporter [Chloroflexota bacterium]